MRIFSSGLCLIAAACGGPPEDVAAGDRREQTPAEGPSEHIACAIGDAAYADVCTIEHAATADGTVLTIRHPDGGFRRLRLTDGSDLVAADGALPAQIIARSEDFAEVAIGDARYRVPLKR